MTPPTVRTKDDSSSVASNDPSVTATAFDIATTDQAKSPTVAENAPVSRSPHREPIAVQKYGDYSTLTSLMNEQLDCFVRRYPARRIRRDEIPVIAAERVMGFVTVEQMSGRHVANEACVFPIVTIADMPPAAYPEHIGYLTRATVAAAACNSAGVAAMMQDRFVQQLAAMVVAVRCGVWAATGYIPKEPVHQSSACMLYQPAKRRAMRRPLAEVKHMDAWYVYFDRAQQVSATMLELAHWLSHLSPVIVGMQCMIASASGESFSIPYVQQAVTRHLKGKLSREAIALANLGKPVVWSAIQNAATHGMPRAATQAWATDPLFQVQAQRRMLSSPSEIASSRRMEEAVKQNTKQFGIDFETASVVGVESSFTTAVRAASAGMRDDDLGSVVDDYEWEDSALRNMTCGHSPGTRSAASSGATTPVMIMTAADAQHIREAVQNAASIGPRATSEMLDANENQEVVW